MSLAFFLATAVAAYPITLANCCADGVLPSTSGQVTAPFPTGAVLGSRDGELYFCVVRGASPAFVVTPPPGLHDLQLTYTTTMPGFVLEEGTTGAMAYTYDAPRLAIDFPNLDLMDRESAGADVITISLLVSGTDAAGKRQHAARTIVIAGEELHMPEQKAAAPVVRRRAAK